MMTLFFTARRIFAGFFPLRNPVNVYTHLSNSSYVPSKALSYNFQAPTTVKFLQSILT